MTHVGSSRSVAVAGWTLTLLDVGAIHAPETWVASHGRDDVFAWLPCRALLCRRGDDVVLVDCGSGPFADAFGLPVRDVDLHDALAAAGASRDEVSALVLTHLDVDHAGGSVERLGDGYRPALPSARLVALRDASDLLTRAGDEVLVAGPIRDALAATGNRALSAVDDGDEIVPGLRLLAAPGHRTGHACVEIEAGGERFVYLADALHAREHVPHPERDVAHDSDPEVALATRRRLIAELLDTGTTVACSHVDSFGRLERLAGEAAWVDVA